MTKYVLRVFGIIVLTMTGGFQVSTAQPNKKQALANYTNEAFGTYIHQVSAQQVRPSSMKALKAWMESAAISPAAKNNIREYLRHGRNLSSDKVKVFQVSNASYRSTGKKGSVFMIFVHVSAQNTFPVQADVIKIFETLKANADDDCRFQSGKDYFCANEDNCDCVSCTGCGCSGCASGGASVHDNVLETVIW
ncbi:MAG: hypothetical protein AAF587_17445 [Bacteroidota bacterium]